MLGIANACAILSLRVAQEIDRGLAGEKINSEIFEEFDKELSKASGVGEPNSTAFLHSDPITTEVFAQAIRDAYPEPVQDLQALGAALMKIVGPVRPNGTFDEPRLVVLYPVHVMTRKSFGLMTRKLSVTESQRSAQFPGTFSRRKLSVASANWAQVA